MAEASIPVDVLNPGQVFACMGFLEAADVLLGDASAVFDLTDPSSPTFSLCARGQDNPFATVLEFLADASVEEIQPDDLFPCAKPAAKVNKNGGAKELLALPVTLTSTRKSTIELTHWADGSSREPFKLYAGNRSAVKIAQDMRRSLARAWVAGAADLVRNPFSASAVGEGTFNFDARKSWTGIDAGYSPNDQGHLVTGSAVVEIMAAWGLENARPKLLPQRFVVYGVWCEPAPPTLARAALGGMSTGLPLRCFRFRLALSGKNKVVTFSQQEEQS